jgi:hypothetical protein
MPITIQKSISWTFLLILACLVVGWINKDPSHDSFWFLIGMALGLVFEAIRIVIRKHDKKKSNLWASVLFLANAVLVILSAFQPILLGVATGLLLPFTIVLIVAQIRFRRVISWEDIGKENK